MCVQPLTLDYPKYTEYQYFIWWENNKYLNKTLNFFVLQYIFLLDKNCMRNVQRAKILTSSKIRSFSSICLNSCLDRLCRLIGVGLELLPLFSLSWIKKVGWPSTVLNIGLRSPLLSNSWAEIFLTGVVAPELHLDWLVPWVGDATRSILLEEFEVAWEINQASTTCRLAFL